MKLILLTLCVFAVTQAEIHWDRSGKYRIIVTEPIEEYRPNPAEYIVTDPKEYNLYDLNVDNYDPQYYPDSATYYPASRDSVSRYPASCYSYPYFSNPVSRYVMRGYAPFYYDYKQIYD